MPSNRKASKICISPDRVGWGVGEGTTLNGPGGVAFKVRTNLRSRFDFGKCKWPIRVS